jgi:archaellin
MSGSMVFVKAVCVSLVVIVLVMMAGCTAAPSGPGGTIPTVSPLSSPTPFPHSTSGPEQSAATIQVRGNIYGLSSNPLGGVDTITFTISPTLKAETVDLTRMKIAFSTPDTDMVILSWGTRESTSIFTTTTGNYPVTSMNYGDEVEIAFRVKNVPGNTNVNIELRPTVGAAVPVSVKVPKVISSLNVLG